MTAIFFKRGGMIVATSSCMYYRVNANMICKLTKLNKCPPSRVNTNCRRHRPA